MCIAFAWLPYDGIISDRQMQGFGFQRANAPTEFASPPNSLLPSHKNPAASNPRKAG
jgi:hypothetical protein